MYCISSYLILSVIFKPCITHNVQYSNVSRATAHAVNHWLLSAEAQVCSQGRLCDICGGQNGIGTVFSPNASTFPIHYQSTDALQSFICQPGNKTTDPLGRCSTQPVSRHHKRITSYCGHLLLVKSNICRITKSDRRPFLCVPQKYTVEWIYGSIR